MIFPPNWKTKQNWPQEPNAVITHGQPQHCRRMGHRLQEFFWFPLSFQKINWVKALLWHPHTSPVTEGCIRLNSLPKHKTSVCFLLSYCTIKVFLPLAVALWITTSAFHACRVPFKCCQAVLEGSAFWELCELLLTAEAICDDASPNALAPLKDLKKRENLRNKRCWVWTSWICSQRTLDTSK